jgi:TPR repeat protein
MVWLRKSAASGYIPAQIWLADHLAPPGSVRPTQGELEEAMYWYQKAADQGDGNALYRLGTFYNEGRGVPKDAATAFSFYLKAAQKGEEYAMRALTSHYYNGIGTPKDLTQYFHWQKRLAEIEDLSGYYGPRFFRDRLRLAAAYYQGIGVEKNLAEAARWTKKAAESGDADAMLQMGNLLAKGEGVAKDMRTAARYRSQAIVRLQAEVEEGIDGSVAALTLGKIYLEGDFVKKEPIRAVYYFSKSDDLSMRNNRQGLRPVAQFQLARLYERGEGVPKDMNHAAALMNAAANDIPQASDALKEAAYLAFPNPKADPIYIGAWVRPKAEQGDNEAQYQLSLAYFAGTEIPQNLEAASGWMKLSAANGNVSAKAALMKQRKAGK